MGEGVDPTQMCQSLVDKVAQSKQLLAITDPGLAATFRGLAGGIGGGSEETLENTRFVRRKSAGR